MDKIKRKPAIEVHQDELRSVGADVQPIDSLNSMALTPHRDDHYMFVLQRSGSFLWEIDFREVRLEGPSISFIAPGQVHRYLDFNKAEGWFVFAGTAFISPSLRNVLDTYLHISQVIPVEKDDPVFTLIPLLQHVLSMVSSPVQASLIGSLLDTLSGLVVSGLAQLQRSGDLIESPKYDTVARFKQLVGAQYKELKQVKAYAALLNITPLYLNEVTKAVTGFPASYWISQALLLEAKRLLYYTALDVRQIAYELGYEDHAYFSRFFRKQTGMTALAFRKTKPLFVPS